MVKNPPANARDMGLVPWSGKIPHAEKELSPCATATELVAWSWEATTTEPIYTVTSEAHVPRTYAQQQEKLLQ